LPLCVEQEHRETEVAVQEENVAGSHELLKQQLEQANDTIATLMEQLKQKQQISQLLTVFCSLHRSCVLLVYLGPY